MQTIDISDISREDWIRFLNYLTAEASREAEAGRDNPWFQDFAPSYSSPLNPADYSI